MITCINKNNTFRIETGEIVTVEKMDLIPDVGILVYWSIGNSDSIFRDSYNDAIKFLNDEKAVLIN
jgi:hypothetical protein